MKYERGKEYEMQTQHTDRYNTEDRNLKFGLAVGRNVYSCDCDFMFLCGRVRQGARSPVANKIRRSEIVIQNLSG